MTHDIALISLLNCRVEWEFWTSSNDACGAGCDRQGRFKSELAETAISLERVNWSWHSSMSDRLCCAACRSALRQVPCQAHLLQRTDSPCGVCSEDTHSSLLTTWFNVAQKAAKARLVWTTASTRASIAPWTVFPQIYKADTRAARYCDLPDEALLLLSLVA